MKFVLSYKKLIYCINKDKKEVFERQNRRTVARQYTAFKNRYFKCKYMKVRITFGFLYFVTKIRM